MKIHLVPRSINDIKCFNDQHDTWKTFVHYFSFSVLLINFLRRNKVVCICIIIKYDNSMINKLSLMEIFLKTILALPSFKKFI